jgi:hypothetical protein
MVNIERRKTEMKSSRILIIVSIVSLIAVSAFAAGTTATKAAPAKHAVSHGIAVRGSVIEVDQKAKTFELKEAKGATVKLSWNDATKMTGAALAKGEQATVRYMVRDGQKVATVINAHPEPKAAAKK